MTFKTEFKTKFVKLMVESITEIFILFCMLLMIDFALRPLSFNLLELTGNDMTDFFITTTICCILMFSGSVRFMRQFVLGLIREEEK